MIKFLVGAVFGFVLASVGVSGVAKIIDSGVTKFQSFTKDAVNGAGDSKVEQAKDAVKKAVE